MAKQEKKTEDKVKAEVSLNSTQEMINLMIIDEKEKKWAEKQLEKEGPKHKKVLNALLLQRLYVMVTSIEKNSAVKFTIQKGLTLVEEKHKKEMMFPVEIPFDLASGMNKKKIMEAMAEAPEHEALAYAMFLQVIAWAIKTLEKPGAGI